jgi:hypothetical protein
MTIPIMPIFLMHARLYEHIISIKHVKNNCTNDRIEERMKEFINEGSFVDNQSHTIFLAE